MVHVRRVANATASIQYVWIYKNPKNQVTKRQKLIIRKARKEDWPLITALISQFPKSLMQNSLPRWSRFFVATKNREIVGCCALDVYSIRIAEVRSLAVASGYQKKGIGSKLIKACIQRAKQLNIHEVIAITGREDVFKKFGFSTFKKEKTALLKVMR